MDGSFVGQGAMLISTSNKYGPDYRKKICSCSTTKYIKKKETLVA